MATEGPAMRRVQVAEHPRWGRGDAALWDRLGRLGADSVLDFWLFAGCFVCSREWTESLGFYKAEWLGLRERPRHKHFTPWFLPRVECFSSSVKILLFPLVLKVVHCFCWALAEVPKLTLNSFYRITWAKEKMIKPWQQIAQQSLHQQIFWGKKTLCSFKNNLFK